MPPRNFSVIGNGVIHPLASMSCAITTAVMARPVARGTLSRGIEGEASLASVTGAVGKCLRTFHAAALKVGKVREKGWGIRRAECKMTNGEHWSSHGGRGARGLVRRRRC